VRERARRIGLDQVLAHASKRQRNPALALIVQRLIDPAEILATSRALDEDSAVNSLGVTLGSGEGFANAGFGDDPLGEITAPPLLKVLQALEARRTDRLPKACRCATPAHIKSISDQALFRPEHHQ